MKRIFTDDDLLRFLYNELPPAESNELLDELVKDEALWERFEAFQHTEEQLAAAVATPSEQSVEHVMNYVKATADGPSAVVATPSPWQRLRSATGKSVVVGLNSLVLLAIGFFLILAVGGSVFPWTTLHQQDPASVAVSHPSAQQEVNLSFEDPELAAELNRIERGVKKLRIKPVL